MYNLNAVEIRTQNIGVKGNDLRCYVLTFIILYWQYNLTEINIYCTVCGLGVRKYLFFDLIFSITIGTQMFKGDFVGSIAPWLAAIMIDDIIHSYACTGLGTMSTKIDEKFGYIMAGGGGRRPTMTKDETANFVAGRYRRHRRRPRRCRHRRHRRAQTDRRWYFTV